MLEYVKSFLDIKTIIGAFLGAIGMIGMSYVNYFRNRLKALKYKVFHERVALANNNPTFGTVKITWNNAEVPNLFISKVVLENTTTKDFDNLKVKILSNANTRLLNQEVRLLGTISSLSFTEDFEETIKVKDGKEPTENQYQTYWHTREILIPVFNRGETFCAQFLVTVDNHLEWPEIYMETLHLGLKLKFEPNHEQVFGIPLKIILPFALIVSFITVILSYNFISQIWIVSSLGIIVGLCAQHIAAFIWYTASRIVKVLFG